MPNIELLEAVLFKIQTDPAHWDQSVWFNQTSCGTTACFAGWTVLLGMPGSEPYLEPYLDLNLSITSLVRLPDGKVQDVSRVAAQLLDVDWETADVLFSAKWSLSELEEVIDKLCTGGYLNSTDW